LQTSVGQNSPDYGRYLDEWMAYYDEMGIRRISAGVLIMRRRHAQKNWFRAHAIGTGRYRGSSGDQIERIFAAENVLQSLDEDRQLLDQRLLFDEHHRLQHELCVEDGRWVVRTERLHASEGIPFAGNVDMYIMSLLVGCDGQRTLRQAIKAVADHRQADPEEFTPACLAVVRKLMQSGFLSAVGDLVK
jgi:hypothetical protein